MLHVAPPVQAAAAAAAAAGRGCLPAEGIRALRCGRNWVRFSPHPAVIKQQLVEQRRKRAAWYCCPKKYSPSRRTLRRGRGLKRCRRLSASKKGENNPLRSLRQGFASAPGLGGSPFWPGRRPIPLRIQCCTKTAARGSPAVLAREAPSKPPCPIGRGSLGQQIGTPVYQLRCRSVHLV